MAYGKYFDAVASGQVFVGSTAVAGVALPISTGTAVTCALWNTSPNKAAVLLGVDIGYTSGTIALGEFGIANQYVGFATATGAPLAAATTGASKNALIGAGNNSSMSFIPATATLTAGGTAVKWLGKSIESATVGLGIFDAHVDLDGGLIVTPGQIVFICGSVAQTAIFTCSMTWAELPTESIPGL